MQEQNLNRPKTNWVYLLIVVVVATIAGAGMLVYMQMPF